MPPGKWRSLARILTVEIAIIHWVKMIHEDPSQQDPMLERFVQLL